VYRRTVPETIFGPISVLGQRLVHGRRVFVIASSQRHVAALSTALAGLQVTVFDGARVHVPIETVEAATAAFKASGADTIVAIGGGSPIGLGKALRLTHDVRFVAVPTTYAGSEMTRMYGITRGKDKQTGREDRVRPDLVVYDVALTLEMPLTISVQSLCNALAHVVSVLSTDSLAPPQRAEALVAARTVVEAIEALVGAPRDRAAREAAQRGASACAALYDQGKPGAQHALAHLLGGAFDLEHAALHALLLPHFLSHLRRTRPELVMELEQAIGEAQLRAHERPTVRDIEHAMREERATAALPALGARLRGLLVAAHAPLTLAALGVSREALEAVLATRPELPAQIALDALT
jgi:maleylacetate reductase